MQKAASRSVTSKVVALDHGKAGKLSNHPASPPIVRIHLVGPMRATSFMGDKILPRGRKARALLGFLCLASGERVSRSKIAAMLWDRVPDFQARASFRQAFRELIVAFGPFARELIDSDRETIRLDTTLCWIDALALIAPEMPQTGADRSELASYCSGELLQELDGVSASLDHWLLGERTRFVERRRALLEAELNHARGANTEVHERAEIARRLIMFDPTHEGARRILMRALADMGERAQALREYELCRDALKASFDVEPSPETYELYQTIRMYANRDERPEPAPAAAAARKRPLKPKHAETNRSRLRVGVLPFMATPSPGDENLALCLSQEIAAALARFRWFDVIAPLALIRRPSATLVNEDQLRHSEFDYVVDGVLHQSGESYQISVRLLDLNQYGTPVWSDRFDLDSRELHRIDEMVTARIVGQIDPVILFIEGSQRRPQKFGASGLLLRAIPMIYSMERDKYERAGELIEQALEMEPDNPMALAWAAYWHLFYVGQGWRRDTKKAFTTVRDYAVRAIRQDPDNAEALGIYAHVCAFADRDFDTAIHYYDRAFRLNPNLAIIWALSAPTYCYIGQPEKALQHLARYRELAPFHPYFFWVENLYTVAYTFMGDYEQAAVVGRRAVTTNPDFVNGYKPLIASLGHLGRIEEAKQYVDKLLALEPNFSLKHFAENYPILKEIDRERYIEGLRLAGVPAT